MSVIASGQADPPGQRDVRRLFTQYRTELLRRALWRTGNRRDAEDLVQETFVRLVKAWPTQGSIVRDEAAYLHEVLNNIIKDYYRSRHRRPLAIREPEEGDSTLQPGWDADEAHLDDDLRDAISTLSERQQEVLLLIYGLDLSPAMAAERMGVSPRDLYRFHYLALNRLRERVAPLGAGIDEEVRDER